ncbi:MAG: ATP phosphoribosyltransferase [Anaerolineales bacterium]|nr:ATP phosphoribosyltransferase [Anaerolineales bacterium]
MNNERNEIRLALPSKGRLSEEALDLLARAGLQVYKPNPRQYLATIPNLPGLTVLFQRAGDIAASVHAGTVDFGITGWDVVAEKGGNGEMLNLLPELGFGFCALHVIVPESWETTHRMVDLRQQQETLGRPLRVATKFPQLTRKFLEQHQISGAELITAEGTLEIAPTIGYSDLIVDLVSSGTTLRDNRLSPLEDGQILQSQACLVANRQALQMRPEVLAVARQLIEFIVAHLRAIHNVAVFANIRGASPQEIAAKMLPKEVIGGLQGPTISQVITHDGGDWYAVNIVVRRDQLPQAIRELRSVGGSGVIVIPVNYIFEEEPQAYLDMLAALEKRE